MEHKESSPHVECIMSVVREEEGVVDPVQKKHQIERMLTKRSCIRELINGDGHQARRNTGTHKVSIETWSVTWST